MISTHRPQSSELPFTLFIVKLKPWVQITRVSKFAGTMLLFWPYAWSLTIAARHMRLQPPIYVSMLIFGFLGASVLHRKIIIDLFWLVGAGCIWNDILDRKYDRQVERTKNRPIAAGTISVPAALVFLSIHIMILMRMIWDLDSVAFKFSVCSTVVIPGIYPFMKRVTYWPQAWLGIAMNVGALLPWLVLDQDLPKSILILFAGAWAWTMWYDTIYACQDKYDDVNAGVKSTALLFGTWLKPILATFASTVVASLYLAGSMCNMGGYYRMISVTGGALYLAREMYIINLDSPEACWDTFHRNGFAFGGLVWAGALAEYITAL